MKPARGRIPLREQMRQSRSAMRAMCTTQAQLDALERDFPEDAPVKPRAERKASGDPSENDIQSEIGHYLDQHPRVAYCLRINSGDSVNTGADGKEYRVRFHYLFGAKRKEMLVSDLLGMMTDARHYAFEIKRPPWRGPKTERELKQEKFLMLVRHYGGIGEFVTSVDDVIRILEAA